MALSPSQIIVLATPVFFGLIALEYAIGRRRGRNTYRLNDAVSSISLGMLSELSKVFTRLLRVGIYAAVVGQLSLVPAEAARTFWTSWYGWLLALVFYDFCYYWLHRAGHECAVLWAAHAVHHQSQDYNLSTALRQTSSGALLGWVFYLPMALAGVPPLVFGVVALVDLLYQFWVHTEQVGQLGWFDRWFCSPSNHRVHHAVNDAYVDRNYGGVLVVWDRLFGSFQPEGERCVYGTRSPLDSFDPLWANAAVYSTLARDSWRTRRWADKLRVWFKPPGWRPPDLAASDPQPPFALQAVRRFNPPLTPALAWLAALQFVALLGGVAVLLWRVDAMPLADAAVWVLALAAGLWAVGALLQGRLSWLGVLAVQAAALATASSAQGLVALHLASKPAALLLVIAWVAAGQTPVQRIAAGELAAAGGATGAVAAIAPAGPLRWRRWLLAGLALSLLGDVLLMGAGGFIPGLVAFLLAHLCYIRLFRLDAPWFASRAALLGTLAVGALMLVLLWPGLGPVLRWAVPAYVLVIALMAAQAIGRAKLLQDSAARAVAAGALCFMLSDALLAINRFATPLPLAQLWVLGSYYLAQLLIAGQMRPGAGQVGGRAEGRGS